MVSLRSHLLSRFLILYGLLYAGFGVQSPYLPSLLAGRNLAPEAIALVLGAGTAIRLIAGPVAGRLADTLDTPKAVLAMCSIAAALIAVGYLRATGFLLLFVVGVLHSATLAPLAPLTDRLALSSAAPARSEASSQRRFHYGWLRGAGSAAFICGTLLSGQAITQFGIAAAVWLNSGLLAATALAARVVPVLPSSDGHATRPVVTDSAIPGFAALLRLPLYRRIIFVAALILGSHAMHDSFAVIRWEAAGIAPSTVGLLWSMSVAGEVVVFWFIGRPLLDRIGPARAAILAAIAGIVRWAIMAETAWIPALAAIQPLHGLTFALLHLTCMRLLAQCVPGRLEATALTVYGTVGIGAPTALLIIASGQIYGRLGASGFWVMAALCALALPLARNLREPG
ncbi:MAG: MFS transporter [Alphaproteobacteria bacterium]|nr:MFS transporter [Alphaproteobacteria bacterium]